MDLTDRVRLHRDSAAFGKLIGNSPAFRRAIEVVSVAAISDATVLVSGETGTGKELIARALHYLSERGTHPFVAVNCGSLTDTLLEDVHGGVGERDCLAQSSIIVKQDPRKSPRLRTGRRLTTVWVQSTGIATRWIHIAYWNQEGRDAYRRLRVGYVGIHRSSRAAGFFVLYQISE